MPYVDLLKSLPQSSRDVESRGKKTADDILIAREFGEDYFDGDRRYGYGGYKYDGRWRQVAIDIVAHYKLDLDSRVLDVGCAKGFLVHDLINECFVDAYGIDISKYATRHCKKEVIGRLHNGTADALPFPDKSFDLVLSINTLHNLGEHRLKDALSEIMRVTKKHAFITVDAYRTVEEYQRFAKWVLTARTHFFDNEWERFFESCGYTGDWAWCII